MDKKIQEFQDGCSSCRILELQNKYYSINPHNSEPRIFWSRLQGMQLVIQLFDLGHIELEHIVPLMAIIQKLDIVYFMHHPKERLSEERLIIEENERIQIFFAIQVRIQKMPQVALTSTSSEIVNAYIFGVNFKSEKFTKLDEGIDEAQKMYESGNLTPDQLTEVIRQMCELFPDEVGIGDEYKAGLN